MLDLNHDKHRANQARKEQLLHELASDLADMVEAGDITEAQANQWLADKQDQWFGGDR